MKNIFIFAFLFILINKLPAQQKLTVEQCVKIAIENNHDHKKAIYDKVIADEKVSEAYGSSVFPSIKGNANYSRALKRGEFILEFGGVSQRIKVGSSNSLTASVDFEQPLFSGAMFLAIKIAKTFADISEHSVKYSEEELISKVKQSYYTYALSKEFIKLADIQTLRAKENLKNAKSMYDAGLVPEYDYIKANVLYKNMIPTQSTARTQENLALNNLLLIMGLDNPKNKYEFVDSLSYRYIPLPAFEEGLKTLLVKNEFISRMKLETKLKDYTADYQFTKHFPELNGFGIWTMQAQEEDSRSFNDWRYINSVTVGLELKIPIFSGGVTQSRVEQAKVDLKKAEEDLKKIKKSVSNDYENLRLQILSLTEQINAYKSAVEESEKGYEIARKRFNAGLGTQIEVSNAAVDVTTSNINYLSSIHDYFIAHAKLDLILGKTIKEIHY